MWNGSWSSQQIFAIDDEPTAGSNNLVKSGGVYAKIKAIEDAGYVFAGVATPSTNPGTPNHNIFYLASEAGTYSNFGSIELQDGLSVLMWNGSWSSQQIFGIDDEPTAGSDNLVKSGGVFTAFDSVLGYITTMPNVYINYNSTTKVLTIPGASYIKTYNESISLGNSEITIDLSTLVTDWVTIVYHKSTSSFRIYNRGYIVNPSNDIVVGQKVSASKYGLILNAIYKVDGVFPFDNTIINNIKFAKQNAIRNIAHQGYSITSQYYGNSRLSSFIAAAKAGFDYGECDLKFSSDNIAVCCHDASFVDSVSGETIIIAEHTFAELETYNYYGETIASFDDVVKVCKQYGIGLYIDHIGNVDTDEKKNNVLSSLKKYRMIGNVRWLTSPASWILEFDAKAKFSIIYSPTGNDYVNDIISTLSSLHNTYPDNDITLDIIYTSISTSDIITINNNIPAGTGIELWTIDSQSTFEEYLPYVLGITSNKVNEVMIKDLG